MEPVYTIMYSYNTNNNSISKYKNTLYCITIDKILCSPFPYKYMQTILIGNLRYKV